MKGPVDHTRMISTQLHSPAGCFKRKGVLKRLSQTMSKVAFGLGFADKVSLPNKERGIAGRCNEDTTQK